MRFIVLFGLTSFNLLVLFTPAWLAVDTSRAAESMRPGMLGQLMTNTHALSVSTNSLDFGMQQVDTTSLSQTVTLTNTSVTSSSIITITTTGDFTHTDDCPRSPAALSIQATCIVTLSFRPLRVGPQTGHLHLDTQAGVYTVSLTGVGQGPTVTFIPMQLDFGAQRAGTTSASQLIELTNTGNDTLRIFQITTTGPFFQTHNCPVASLGVSPTGACQIFVVFNPTTSGVTTGTLLVSSNAYTSPHQVGLSGQGVMPQVSLIPSFVDFGAQTIALTSSTQIISLTNSGNMSLTIDSIAITGEFQQQNQCPMVLGAGAQCAITTTFTPLGEGSWVGALTVHSDAPDSPHSTGLSGIGVSDDTNVMQISPDHLVFTNQVVSYMSAMQVVTLENQGKSPVTLQPVSITGDFTYTNNCPILLAVDTACTIEVVFAPTRTGPRLGTLSIPSGAQIKRVSLRGQGTPNPCPAPLAAVTITETTSLTTPLYAQTIPLTATQPITYQWTPTPTIGQYTNIATYTWQLGQRYTISVMAANCGNVVSDTVTVRYVAQTYLPLVLQAD